MTTILERYQQLHPTSSKLHSKALKSLPSGITHDLRHLTPFPLYVDHALGCKKWDVDGNEYIDYLVGHGSLLLGHSHPKLVDAVSQQVSRGTHYGASHRLEIQWADWVKRLIPSAEKVRFTNSGTEATLMALRLARAYTGHSKIIRFEDHFHGWHDYVHRIPTPIQGEHTIPGIPEEALSTVYIIPCNNIELVERILKEDEDVAAIIVEPTGASWGTVPIEPGFLVNLRDLSQKYGSILILDEVITGFRVAPGGAQQVFNILPDLTTLGKCLAGGLPGAAVAGRTAIMSLLEFKDDPKWNMYGKVAHPGTYNANPLSAAAGVAFLAKLADGEAQQYCNTIAKKLRQGLNRVLDEERIPGCVYGDFSMFHLILGKNCPHHTDCDREACTITAEEVHATATSPEVGLCLRRGLLNNRVAFWSHRGGMLSTAHNDEDIAFTIDAFRQTLVEMRREGIFS